jgi:hypothetical protein
VVQGEVRGFLSDRYRRLDTGLCVDAFANAIREYGAKPIQARCLDTKFYIKAVLPEIFEPFPGEYMVLGISMKNSDYGDGAYELRLFLYRVWCKNLALCEDALRRVHLGSRIDENLAISEKTYRLDNETMASATVDAVKAMLAPAMVKNKMALLKAAHDEGINVNQAIKALRTKTSVTKAEADNILNVYNTGGIEDLPHGDNAWRFSNAISLFSQSGDVTPSRRLELEVIAGEVAGLHRQGV